MAVRVSIDMAPLSSCSWEIATKNQAARTADHRVRSSSGGHNAGLMGGAPTYGKIAFMTMVSCELTLTLLKKSVLPDFEILSEWVPNVAWKDNSPK